MQVEAVDADSSTVLDAIRRIVQAARLSSRRTEQELGITGAQLFILRKLAEAQEPFSMSDVAAVTLTHLSTVSVVVGRLVERGYVLRSASAADGRRLEIRLSAKGRAFLRRNLPMTMQEHLVRALATLPGERRALLAELLTTVIVEAGFANEEAAMLFEEATPATADGGSKGP